MANKKKNNKKNKSLEVELVKKKEILKKNKTSEVNDKIQSTVSIFYTIVIIIMFIILLFVVYNQFFKPKQKIDILNVCSDFIKKDYDIDEELIINYIKNNRHIIYNINNFDISNIDRETINDFSKYIIWNNDSEYILCNNENYCLDTKKEMDYSLLKKSLESYFNLDMFNIIFNYDFKDSDTTRLYLNNDKVVLTFKSMQYETYKHDIVDINIDENNVYIIFALSKRIDETNYSYIGSKNIKLVYNNNKFNLESIKTRFIN